MKDIRPIRGKYYIRQLIEQGEHEHQDFKYAISDARKIARSISAFANNDGGRLLVGVKDNGSIVGIPNEEDIYMIENAAERYCIPPAEVVIDAFKVENGAVVLRVDIHKAHERPVYCLEENNRKVAYIRVKDQNIAAHPIMVRGWEMSKGKSSFACSAEERGILSWISENEPVNPDDMHLKLHISRERCEDALSFFASMNLIVFVHTPHGFMIVIPKDEEDGDDDINVFP